MCRRRTLRETLDWSYGLLDPRQRAVLDEMSVFSGACNLEAVERVCVGDDVLDHLAQLVDWSLVVAEPQADGTMRYSLLESVKAYAAERLEHAGREAIMRRRHAVYFVELAESAEPELRRADQASWLDRLDRDHDNLRAAVDWCIAHHESQLGLRLGAALARFWYVRGYLNEGLGRLERLLAMPSTPADASVRVAVLNGAGNLAWTVGDLDRAETFLDEALTLGRHLCAERDLARTLYELTKVAADRGRADDALRLAEQARAAWERQDDSWGTAVALNMLGELMRERGDVTRGRQFYEDSLRLFIALDDTRGRAIVTHNLAILAAARDDLQTAIELQRAILPLKLQLGDREGIVCSLIDLAALGHRRGERAQAALLCGAAETERARIRAILPAHERSVYSGTVATVRQAMGATAFDAAFSTGSTIGVEAAVAAAIAPALDRSVGTPTELTTRELEVLGLIAAGRSNREIAAELVLSVRTVERHIENIYGKIGASGRVSRAIATAYVYTHPGLVESGTV
jgi:ATP/maltotriose-dependent transcriptional regulator MalT